MMGLMVRSSHLRSRLPVLIAVVLDLVAGARLAAVSTDDEGK